MSDDNGDDEKSKQQPQQPQYTTFIIDIETLRALRKARGWNQKQLADAAGINRTILSRIERANQTDLKASILVAIARALKTTVDSLLTVEARPQISPLPLLTENNSVQLLTTTLNLTITEIASLPEPYQWQVAAMLRAYISSIPVIAKNELVQ